MLLDQHRGDPVVGKDVRCDLPEDVPGSEVPEKAGCKGLRPQIVTNACKQPTEMLSRDARLNRYVVDVNTLQIDC